MHGFRFNKFESFAVIWNDQENGVLKKVLNRVTDAVDSNEAVAYYYHLLLVITFHVRLVVEVRHLPAVLLVVVVMRVRRVMRRRYGLGVRCRAVVEVHLRTGLVVGLGHQLLGLLDAFRPGAYHPHEQRDDDKEYDGGRDAARDVRKVRLILAVRPDERADATAGRLAAQVLDARALVLAVVLAHVLTRLAGAVEAGSALALEVRRLRYQQTVGVYVAVFARHVRLARVPALGLTGLRWEEKNREGKQTVSFGSQHHRYRLS